MSHKSDTQPRIQGKFASNNSEPLSKKVTGVRLPISLHNWVHQKPNSTDWVRKVIVEAAQREMSQNSRF